MCVVAGRPWPLAFGAGVGIGMGFSNCQHDFMYPGLHHGQLKKVKTYDSCLVLVAVAADWAGIQTHLSPPFGGSV